MFRLSFTRDTRWCGLDIVRKWYLVRLFGEEEMRWGVERIVCEKSLADVRFGYKREIYQELFLQA
jgi:hypothetical protein